MTMSEAKFSKWVDNFCDLMLVDLDLKMQEINNKKKKWDYSHFFICKISLNCKIKVQTFERLY